MWKSQVLPFHWRDKVEADKQSQNQRKRNGIDVK
jgi:hypothetical protein